METAPPADLLPFMLRVFFLLLLFSLLLFLFYLSLDCTRVYREVCRWLERTVDSKIVMINKDDFSLFHKVYISWSQPPCERDARYIREALLAKPISKNIIMELACTRSSHDLVAIKTAYHSLFKTTLDEEVARYITSPQIEHKSLGACAPIVFSLSPPLLLTALMHGYRYEGEEVNEKLAKSDALNFFYFLGVEDTPPMDDYIVMILASRSILHIKSLLHQYQQTIGNSLYDELGTTHSILKDTLQCLCSPSAYFCKVIEGAMIAGETNETRIEDLARVIVTRAEVDMKDIKQEFYRKHGISLSQSIVRACNRNYIEFLFMSIKREDDDIQIASHAHTH